MRKLESALDEATPLDNNESEIAHFSEVVIQNANARGFSCKA
jgi:hypothetical protein